MWRKVYYEHFAENWTGKYWEEEKVLPYMVHVPEKAEREKFKEYLISRGFECCAWNNMYMGILVNTKFKRFAMIHRPCKFSCVDDKNYSIQEFKEEIMGDKESI